MYPYAETADSSQDFLDSETFHYTIMSKEIA